MHQLSFLDISKLLEELAVERPIFHSERDFQHALAWGIHEKNPEASVRLERRPPFLKTRTYLDIWVSDLASAIAIELKYKTRSLRAEVDGEVFDLQNHGAQDIGRYYFLKDVERLEGIVGSSKNAVGYAILLTNDSLYWKPSRDGETIDSGFRLHEGRVVSGKASWSPEASAGTTVTREKEIALGGSYKLSWEDYSEPAKSASGAFRYLMLRIRPQA